MRSAWRVAVLVLLGLGLTGCMWLFPPPQAVLTASVMSGTAPLSVTFNLAGSTGQIASYTLAFGDASTPAPGTDITVAVVHTYTAPGTYTATLTVRDDRGRTSSDTVVITVTAPPTPTVSFGAIPTSGPAPLAVNFWFAVTAAPGRRIVHLRLEYGDGEPDLERVVNEETYDDVIPYTYADPGTYTATLTATDDAAQATSASVTITVTSPPPAITAFTTTPAPATGPAPLAVDFDFDAVAGATGRRIVRYTLSFGDTGSLTEEGLNYAHPTPLTRSIFREYVQTGSYTATLRVWDDLNNTDEDSLSITVTP